MKIIFYLLPLLVLLSCSQNQKADNLSIEVISINLDKKENEEMSEFIEKIELVPLHTDTNSIISTYKKIDYCDELDMFIILDISYDTEEIVSLMQKDEFYSTCFEGKDISDYEEMFERLCAFF